MRLYPSRGGVFGCGMDGGVGCFGGEPAGNGGGEFSAEDGGGGASGKGGSWVLAATGVGGGVAGNGGGWESFEASDAGGGVAGGGGGAKIEAYASLTLASPLSSTALNALSKYHRCNACCCCQNFSIVGRSVLNCIAGPGCCCLSLMVEAPYASCRAWDACGPAVS